MYRGQYPTLRRVASVHWCYYFFVPIFGKISISSLWNFHFLCAITVSYTHLAFGSIFHIAIEKIFQAVGNMVVPMVLQAVGAVINIVLDPIFIFGYFGIPALGVKGAALSLIHI